MTDKQVDEAVAYFEHLKCGDDCRCEDCQQWKVILTAVAVMREDRRKRDAEVLRWLANQERWPHLEKAMLLAQQIESGEIVVNKE